MPMKDIFFMYVNLALISRLKLVTGELITKLPAIFYFVKILQHERDLKKIFSVSISTQALLNI